MPVVWARRDAAGKSNSTAEEKDVNSFMFVFMWVDSRVGAQGA